jgi:hypothetical protein
MTDVGVEKPSRELIRFARHFRGDQPVGFLATEALVNPDVQDLLPMDKPAPTKFGRAIQAARSALPPGSPFFSATPDTVAVAFEMMRKDLRGAADDNAAAIMLRDALTRTDTPSFVRLSI